jgi:hypothetical protein
MDDPPRSAARRRAAKTGESAARQLVRRAIRELSATEASGLAGGDSVLQTLWDEICVQVQGEHSVFWSAYEDRVGGVLEVLLRDTDATTLHALWLGTPEGEDWFSDVPMEGFSAPYVEEHVVEFLRGRLYVAAADWSNARIRACLERSMLD